MVCERHFLNEENLYFNAQPEILEDKTMNDKSMYIPNDYKQNYPFCIFNLIVQTFRN